MHTFIWRFFSFFLKKSGLLFLAIIFVMITVVTAAFDSTRVRVRHLTIENDAFASVLAGKKLVHISDTHFRTEDSQHVEVVLDMLDSLQPDYVFLTGDLVRWYGWWDDYQLTFDFLKKVRASDGVFAVMGDSDYSFSRASCSFCHAKPGSETISLNQTKFLRDQFIDHTRSSLPVRIAGIDCGPYMLPDVSLADSLSAATPTILLSHTSTVFDSISDSKNVLVLAGDTHGGQIYLPDFIWKWWRRKPDPEHMYGFFRERNKMLYVTSGVGTSDIIFRLGVPAEIAVIEFVPEKK